MTVAQLIDVLKGCPVDAIVEVEDRNFRVEVDGVRDTFPDRPGNKYVILTSALSRGMGARLKIIAEET